MCPCECSVYIYTAFLHQCIYVWYIDMPYSNKFTHIIIVIYRIFTVLFLLYTCIIWKWKSLSHTRLFAPPWTVHGILQARIVEWVAFPFSRGSSQPRDWTQVSHFADGFFTSWATREAREYWSGYPIPSPADLPNRDLLHSRCIIYQLSYQGRAKSDHRGLSRE